MIQQLADATSAGDADTIRHLLAEAPGLASDYTDEGWTALHLAATAEIAAMLLNAGADIDARNRHKVFGPATARCRRLSTRTEGTSSGCWSSAART